ncbi:MAG: Copper-exporting P-type ATPase B [Chlamydiae bacterium]|nr:Copper-exporting P-type ATPase B [Chlamydiota bacterium]
MWPPSFAELGGIEYFVFQIIQYHLSFTVLFINFCSDWHAFCLSLRREAKIKFRLSRATYTKMPKNLAWATGYDAFAIPLAAGALYPLGILLNPAVVPLLVSLSTVIVAIHARFLHIEDKKR